MYNNHLHSFQYVGYIVMFLITNGAFENCEFLYLVWDNFDLSHSFFFFFLILSIIFFLKCCKIILQITMILYLILLYIQLPYYSIITSFINFSCSFISLGIFFFFILFQALKSLH